MTYEFFNKNYLFASLIPNFNKKGRLKIIFKNSLTYETLVLYSNKTYKDYIYNNNLVLKDAIDGYFKEECPENFI